MSAYTTVPALVHAAVSAGESADQVRLAIEIWAHGSAERRVQAVNRANETSLEAAIRLERPDLVGLLLEAGADVKPLYGGLATPLAVCAAYGTTESLRALLRAGHDAKEKIWYEPPAHRGCGSFFEYYQSTAAHLCLSPPKPNDSSSSSSSSSSSPPPPHLEALEVLVTEGGVDVDARDAWGRTPLMWLPYASADHEAALDLLLRLGADVNARSWSEPRKPLSEPDESPLIVLLQNYHGPAESLLPCVRTLVAAGACTSGVFDRYDRSPLAMAAAKGHAAVVRFLLEEARVPVNERDPKTNRTALHFCYLEFKADVLSMLLDAGADVESRDNQGRTPIFSAVQDYTPAALRLLLERGASPDVFDGELNTPLMVACTRVDGIDWAFAECAAMVQLLLRHSSPETKNAVRESDGHGSLDDLLLGLWEHHQDVQRHMDGDDAPAMELYESIGPDQQRVIAEMLAAGVPFLAENADILLPLFVKMVAPRAERAAVEMAARVSAARRWRAHEDVVALALDAKEAREAEAEVEAAERRVAALERRLRELDVEEEEDDDDDEEEEKGAEDGGDGDGDGE